MCVAGASRAGADLLATVPRRDLRAYYVWTPVLPDDRQGMAAKRAWHLAEPRARHYWDSDGRLAQRMAAALNISEAESLEGHDGHGIAWDTYLAYDRGPLELERPAFWMHQLYVSHAPRLDAEEWQRRVEELLVRDRK